MPTIDDYPSRQDLERAYVKSEEEVEELHGRLSVIRAWATEGGEHVSEDYRAAMKDCLELLDA